MTDRGDLRWGTIPRLVEDAASRFGDAVAVADDDERVSFADLGARVDEAARAVAEVKVVTAEIRAYLPELMEQRRATPKDDLLTRLVEAEVDGERLTESEISGFFQLLLVAGTETTTNLIEYISNVQATNDRKNALVGLVSRLQKPMTEQFANMAANKPTVTHARNSAFA